MDNELKDLSDTLVNIYQKNLSFLEENFTDVYDDIQELSNKIETNEYKEEYSLEYIDGHFDILNLENNGLFYNTNSYEDADMRANHSNFTLDASLNLLRRDPNSNKLVSSEGYGDVMPIIQYMNDTIDFDDIKFQRIYKFVFIGVGLGLHLHEINKKLNPFITLVMEPSIEIFRLSLFIVDYSVFDEGNKSLILSVGDDKDKRNAKFSALYHHSNYMNYNVKHHLLLESYDYIREELISYFHSSSATYFPYKAVVQNLFRTIDFMKNKDKFLSIHLLNEKLILKNHKVLIISAGPSLQNNIEWIKENQDKFLIVAVDVIVRKLEDHNIKPDIVTSIDPDTECAEFITTKDPDYLKDCSFFFLSQQHPSVIEAVRHKHYYFTQVMPLRDELGWLGTVPNVGTFSFNMMLHLGAKEIYLVGADAAFDQKTGKQYANDVLEDIINETEINPKKDEGVSAQDVFEVKGNLRETVKTNRLLFDFVNSYKQSIAELKDHRDYKAYNLSDGSYIEGIEPLTIDSANKHLENSSIVENKNIQKELASVCTEIKNLDYAEDIKLLNSIITKAKKFQKMKFSSGREFLDEKLGLMVWILEKTQKLSTGVFSNIFLHYTELVDIYVNFLLNLRQEDLHKKETINKVNQMWTKGVITVIKDLKDAVK